MRTAEELASLFATMSASLPPEERAKALRMFSDKKPIYVSIPTSLDNHLPTEPERFVSIAETPVYIDYEVNIPESRFKPVIKVRKEEPIQIRVPIMVDKNLLLIRWLLTCVLCHDKIGVLVCRNICQDADNFKSAMEETLKKMYNETGGKAKVNIIMASSPKFEANFFNALDKPTIVITLANYHQLQRVVFNLNKMSYGYSGEVMPHIACMADKTDIEFKAKTLTNKWYSNLVTMSTMIAYIDDKSPL